MSTFFQERPTLFPDEPKTMGSVNPSEDGGMEWLAARDNMLYRVTVGGK